MRSASRANTISVVSPSIGAERFPVRHSSHVPTICTIVCAASKFLATVISSMSDSTSELRNSDERWQIEQTMWKWRGWWWAGSNRERPSPKSTLRAMPAPTIHWSVR